MLAAQAFLSEACDPLREAVRREPRHVEAWIKLGEVEKALGAIDAAVLAFRRAIGLRPEAGAAWWGLANLKTVAFTRHEMATLDRLWSKTHLPVSERILIGYARAHAHVALATPDSAWPVLLEANRLKRSTVSWDAAAHTRHVDALIEAWPAIVPSESRQGAECIFIVGLPRSGSTLIEQVLAAHPSIEGASELPDLELVLRDAAAAGVDVSPAVLAQAEEGLLLALGRDYLGRTQRWRTRRAISIDKTPANFLHIGLILRMLPAAKIIDCRRDARDTALSCLMQHFAGFAAWSNDADEIRAYYLDYRRLMEHWRRLAPGRVIHVQYEDFVARPEQATRELLESLGLDFHESCLTPHRVKREVRTASAAQVVEPMDQRGHGRWKPFAAHFESWDADG
jgi:tetratricopeptide (TPR) repeat protein